MIPGDFQYTKPTKQQLLKFGALGIFGLATFAGIALVLTFVISSWLGRPVIFGFNDGPTQPIAFPHTVHTGTDILLDAQGSPRLDAQGQPLTGVGLDCTFCHRTVTKQAAASIPPVGLCATCHMAVGDGIAEVEKLRDIIEEGAAIDWVRVHRVPDHVNFVHEAHVRFFSARDGIAPSATCSTCHGDVAAMTQVKQVRSLKMGDCVDCHRDNGAPTDCTTCHF